MAVQRVDGVVFLVKRQGQYGKIGPVLDVTRCVSPSAVIYDRLRDGYYVSGPEEFRAITGLEPYDFDGDGDYDDVDRKLIVEIRKANEDIAESHSEDVEEGAIQSPEERTDKKVN